MEIYATLDRVAHDFKGRYELIELAVYSLLAFSIPLLFTHPQLLAGSIVNGLLVLAALHMRGRKLLPFIILPSIAAVLNGLLFGPFTLFLAFMLPFIWLGNFAFIYLIKKLHVEGGSGFWPSVIPAALFKAVLLYFAALALSSIIQLPSAIVSAMGLMQAATALIGAFTAFIFRPLRAYLLK